MTKKTIESPRLDTLHVAAHANERNRLLLDWLSDDVHRAELYRQINGQGGYIDIPSRDAGPRVCDCRGLEAPWPAPNIGHKPVRLITDRARIEAVLRNEHDAYSSRVYAELGGGSFMLALDPHDGDAHAAQRWAFASCFSYKNDLIGELSHLACEAASIMSLRAPEFDLAAFAEQAAVRFCQKLLGYASADYRMLETALRAGYAALVYQVFGRHFTTDPLAIPEAKQTIGKLLARTSKLIGAYAADDGVEDNNDDDNDDALKGTKDDALPNGFQPVLRRLADYGCGLNGEQRAVIAVGAALGTMGNVQAAVCIAVKAFFAKPALLDAVRKLALSECGDRTTNKFSAWQALIEKPLRKNPPIPFLPRMETGPDGKVREVLLALGGGTKQGDGAGDDPLIWGLSPAAPHGCARQGATTAALGPAPAGQRNAHHWCAGQALAWPLIVETIRHVMRLPEIAERLDPGDATVIGLKKRWGFACESYPLTHQRGRRVAQSSLNAAMRLKSPVKDNADRVREVIRAGAPRIEEALRQARHVHFAWFELVESDTVLVLHTVYDGPFSAYIQHFALKVGDLFDALFDCIENPPPMPVAKFPNEFVAHIQRYDRAPAMGYFFSAYPRSDVAHILRDEMARP